MRDSFDMPKRSSGSAFMDRFIPRLDSQFVFSPGSSPSKNSRSDSQQRVDYDSLSPSTKLLSYHSREKKKANNSSFENSASSTGSRREEKATFESKPIRALEAPGLMDDYYLNLLEWGQGGHIAIGLEASLNLYNFNTGETTFVFDVNEVVPESRESFGLRPQNDAYLCSLSFDADGKRIACGDSRGFVYIADLESGKVVSHAAVHEGRVGSIHWQEGRLATGSKDKLVRLFDVRENFISSTTAFAGHMQEICGLKLSPNGAQLATGGNDNQLNLWDLRGLKPLGVLGTHEAAVKALAWHPKQSATLLSGSGTADRKIRTFDTHKLEEVSVIDTGSQVCSLAFDPDAKYLVSTHGYSLNQMILWDAEEELKKIDCVVAHRCRVLYLSASPCGRYVATGAGDETLKLWRIVKPLKELKKGKSIFSGDIMRFR